MQTANIPKAAHIQDECTYAKGICAQDTSIEIKRTFSGQHIDHLSVGAAFVLSTKSRAIPEMGR